MVCSTANMIFRICWNMQRVRWTAIFALLGIAKSICLDSTMLLWCCQAIFGGQVIHWSSWICRHDWSLKLKGTDCELIKTKKHVFWEAWIVLRCVMFSFYQHSGPVGFITIKPAYGRILGTFSKHQRVVNPSRHFCHPCMMYSLGCLPREPETYKIVGRKKKPRFSRKT